MTQVVQLEVDEMILERARGVAERTGQPVEGVLRDWLNDAADNLPIELMPDEQVLSLAESMLPESEQAELSELLDGNREGTLNDTERVRFDELMSVYRRGLIRKAQALKVAVQRGLIAPLSN